MLVPPLRVRPGPVPQKAEPIYQLSALQTDEWDRVPANWEADEKSKQGMSTPPVRFEEAIEQILFVGWEYCKQRNV